MVFAPKSEKKLRLPRRVTPNLPIVNETGLFAWTIPWQVKPPDYSPVVVVKATYTIGADGTLTLAPEQAPPSGDVAYEPDDSTPAGTSLRYASDFAIFKPAADVMLVGHAYPPDDTVGVSNVELRVGNLRRRLAVFGDRKWGGFGFEGKPARFQTMPLRWERAMGGPLSEANPVGRGFKTGVLVPNLERPESLLQTRDNRPAPACFAPIAPGWKARSEKTGKYDSTWLKERWPYLPADFDWSHFNAAPPEQQVPYLRGDERFAIIGVRPGGKGIEGRLPGTRPRVFAQRTEEVGGDFFEILLRLDTAWFDADDGQAGARVARPLRDARRRFAGHRGALRRSRAGGDDAPARRSPGALPRAHRVGGAAAHGRDVLSGGGGARGRTARAACGRRVHPRAGRSKQRSQRARRCRSADLTGIDLNGANLAGADLTGAILAHANLTDAVLDRAKLAGAVLAGVRAERASFVEADLTQADLTGAWLGRAVFDRALLGGALVDAARAAGASFVSVQADRASFVGATLEGAKLDGAKLALRRPVACDADRRELRAGGARRRAALRRARRTARVRRGFDGPRPRGEGVAAARVCSRRSPRRSRCGSRRTSRVPCFTEAKLPNALFMRAKLDETVLARPRRPVPRSSARASSEQGACART